MRNEMKNSNKKIKDPVFSDERELARWIAQTPLSIEDKDHKGNYVIDLVNKPVHVGKFINDYKKRFPCEIYPTEFDLISTGGINYPIKDHFFESPGDTLLTVVELKYFRRRINKEGEIESEPSRYNEGIEQSIANINFGFYIVQLWHFFDPNFPEDLINIFTEQMQKDLKNYNLPIIYNIYRIEYGDKEKKFYDGKLKPVYNNPINPKSYKKDEKMKCIEKFISEIRIDINKEKKN